MTTAALPTTSRASSASAFLALLARDVRVLGKNLPGLLVRIVMQPLLFTFVFAYVLPKTGMGFGGARPGGTVSVATVLVPGLVATSTFFQGIQSVALQLTQEFGYTKEIEDRVLAPLPVWGVALGKIAAGVVQSLIAAVVVFPIVLVVHAHGQAPKIHIHDVALLIVALLVTCVLGASFGLAVGVLVEPRQIPFVFALVVLPSTLLGCVYYPWSTLASVRWLQVAVLINPVVYMSEAFRGVLTPSVHHMPLYVSLGAMLLLSVVFIQIGVRGFRRRVVS
jgi:ABC-2 type transport system permease protein